MFDWYFTYSTVTSIFDKNVIKFNEKVTKCPLRQFLKSLEEMSLAPPTEGGQCLRCRHGNLS